MGMNIESVQGASRAGKRERAFDLSLPASVTGLDAVGRRFEERTEICSISAQEASFRLQTRLLIGSKILLHLDVPRTLILEKPLRLMLSGTVVFVKSEDSRGKKQYVSARLDRGYKLQSNS
ncbi:MAG: hypothetical protein MUP28_06510 [Candidatus Aminicenantes bacterium]|nr:hypothetical protein [Candidatus Aminicenantes bacterium]